MSNELPTSWLSLKLGDVLDYGRTDKVEPELIRPDDWILELEDIEKETSRLIQRITFSDRQSKSTKNRFNKGDVLYGKLRPYLSKLIIAPEAGYCSTDILPLASGSLLDNRFLFYWLKHPVFRSYVDAVSHGLDMPRLGTDAGKNAPLVLAPLNEQKRIADKLDALLGRVDACRKRLERVPILLKRFRQSVLAAATSGHLTADWRERTGEKAKVPSNEGDLQSGSDFLTLPPSWYWAKIESLITEKPYNGISIHGSDKPPGTAVLKLDAMNDAGFNYDRIKYIDIAPDIVNRLELCPGDFFVSRGNGSLSLVGRGTLVKEKPTRVTVYPDLMIRLRFPPELTIWISSIWGSPNIREQIERSVKTTAGIWKISQKDLVSIQVPVPPKPERIEIERRLVTIITRTSIIERSVIKLIDQLRALQHGMLAKAFIGELVPQDPNDEPASELLARVKKMTVTSQVKKEKSLVKR